MGLWEIVWFTRCFQVAPVCSLTHWTSPEGTKRTCARTPASHLGSPTPGARLWGLPSLRELPCTQLKALVARNARMA